MNPNASDRRPEPAGPKHRRVVVVGGGMSGLIAATHLRRADVAVTVLEADDRVGGRVRTDRVDGYLLDHGFQVYLTAYETCGRYLDLSKLDLRPFRSGALIRAGGRFRVLGDPWKDPRTFWSTATHPVATLGDKLRIARLRRDVCRGDVADIADRPNPTTESHLRDLGFSDRMIDQFFRPFIGGVFLDDSLRTPRRMFDFVFRHFALGRAALPADGIDRIPRQLADGLGDVVQLRRTVVDLGPDGVTTADGRHWPADAVIVATERDAATRLLTRARMPIEESSGAGGEGWTSTVNILYDVPAEAAHPTRGYLMLRGDEKTPVQTMAMLTDVARGYAPPGRSLLSVSLSTVSDEAATNRASSDDVYSIGAAASLDLSEIDALVRPTLNRWFGCENADRHRALRVYSVPFGLPRRDLEPMTLPAPAGEIRGGVPVYLAGDHRATASLEGAAVAGRRAAEACLAAWADRTSA